VPAKQADCQWQDNDDGGNPNGFNVGVDYQF
jgi:hypothetical protein